MCQLKLIKIYFRTKYTFQVNSSNANNVGIFQLIKKYQFKGGGGVSGRVMIELFKQFEKIF